MCVCVVTLRLFSANCSAELLLICGKDQRLIAANCNHFVRSFVLSTIVYVTCVRNLSPSFIPLFSAALVDNEDIKAGNLASYSDGSVENDLPMQQLSELFNVNHFIVSQVHILWFSALCICV